MGSHTGSSANSLRAARQIVVLGSLNQDLVIAVPRLPLPGDTVMGERLENFPGGKGANQAVAAARLGGQVAMVGRVGDDSFGTAMVNNLDVNGVDSSLSPSIRTSRPARH